LIDVKIYNKSINGYTAFIKTFIKKFNVNLTNNSNKKLYYWLFNTTIDKPTLSSYINYNPNDAQNNIKLMLESIYFIYIDLLKQRFFNFFDTITPTNFDLNKFNILLSIKYADLDSSIKNQIIEKILLEKLLEYEIITDDIESILPHQKTNLFSLPILKQSKHKKSLIVLSQKDKDTSLELTTRLSICYHYIKWKLINSLSKKSDEFNQAVFEFVKQYTKEGEHGEYLCKSCNEVLQIQKFIVEGTYVEELDVFLTTSMIVNLKLEEIPKYAKYTRTLRNLEKNIEKFTYSIDMMNLVGNTPVVKIRRKSMIKDIIDLILIHTEWLKNQGKHRIEQMNKKYGIDKNLSNLFFFEIKDDIFLTSSTDTDYYKIIKYNNIMVYILLLLITELNAGQILFLRYDIKYNFYVFNKIFHNIFKGLYLRINQKDKIEFTQLPLFSYIIFYLSGIMISKKLWLYTEDKTNSKDKQLYLINLQKTIIHTFIDLINSIIEANMEENKNYLYEIISARISDRLLKIFNDKSLLTKLEEHTSKYIKIDDTTQKISIVQKKINFINLNEEFNTTKDIIELCNLATLKIKKLPMEKSSNSINILTNCQDGAFHDWIFKSNDLICSICNNSYNELYKWNTTDTTQTDSKLTNINYLEKLKIFNLKKLALKYCIDGNTHDLNSEGICKKCNENLNNFTPSSKQLKELEKNIEKKSEESVINNINQMKHYMKNLEKQNQKQKIFLTKFNKKYKLSTKNQLESFIDTFINNLIQILGEKIKIDNSVIYIKETAYIIDHDYLGYAIKEPIIITSTDDIIHITFNHVVFSKDVLYYRDKQNKVYVYYDLITFQYLGYSEDNKNIKYAKTNASLIVQLSIKESIMLLGYENQFYNLYHINANYEKDYPFLINTIDKNNSKYTDTVKDILLTIIRNRMNNLKQIIIRTQSILYNIQNNGKISSIYNNYEKEIIKEFTKKIKKIAITDASLHNKIFKHNTYIINNVFVDYNIPNIELKINKNYIDVNNISILNNSDCKLIFYLIYNLNKLLEYNTKTTIITDLAYLIIKIIRYLFNIYYKPYSNYNVRKFDFLLINEIPYINENLKTVGNYQELLTQEEIDDPDAKEQMYTQLEAFDSLDIDDYEPNEDFDIDNSFEALDGYE
jgi:hypothetical protein